MSREKYIDFLETKTHIHTIKLLADVSLSLGLYMSCGSGQICGHARETNLLITYNSKMSFSYSLDAKPTFSPIFILIFYNWYNLFLLINVLCYYLGINYFSLGTFVTDYSSYPQSIFYSNLLIQKKIVKYVFLFS